MDLLISIHALREEGDLQYSGTHRPSLNFYPRPPRGGRPAFKRDMPIVVIFLSTPSARRATSSNPVRLKGDMISIHALREEGDTTQ